MNKNLIKSYALNLKEEDVKKYALKENVSVTNEEASLFVNTVKENIDEILDGKALEVLDSIKNRINHEAYDKLIELFDKYKKFID